MSAELSNQQILEKAIQKAIDGGWEAAGLNTPYARKNYSIQDIVDHFTDEATEYSPADIIFNHQFAKAFFGEEPYYRFDGDTLDTPKQWQYHLQQMVIAEDPIKYLGENIDK